MTPPVTVTTVRRTAVGLNVDVALEFPGVSPLELRGLRLHRQPEGWIVTSAQIRVDDNLIVPCVMLPKPWRRAVIAAVEAHLEAATAA